MRLRGGGRKVFGIGYPRTGTTSLVSALNLLGIRTLHNPTGLAGEASAELLQEFDGFADAPLPLIYRDLDSRVPGSKFILTDRDVDEWLASIEWMIENGRKYGRWDSNPRVVSMHRALYGSMDFRRAEYRERFLRHRHEVLEYFAKRPSDLLVLELGRGDEWARLCPFLGCPVPGSRFPRDNRRARYPRLKRLEIEIRRLVVAISHRVKVSR